MPHEVSQRKPKLCSGLRAVLGCRGRSALRRVEHVLQGLGIAPAEPRSPSRQGTTPHDNEEAPTRAPEPLEQRKFDLGPREEEEATPTPTIPWGYGENRVTAMPVDPDTLYVYWEITDEAIAAARANLGAGGATAWLDLRVYDVTHRIFDGTNAHSYFDHRVERHDRQWFFAIGKPGSTAVVDVGLKSIEGYFVRVARSGRVDFPRAEMAEPGAVEWLTVRSDTGEAAQPVVAPPPERAPERTFAVATNGRRGAADDRRRAPLELPGLADGLAHALAAAPDAPEPVVPGTMVRRWDWREVLPGGWTEIRRTVEWHGEVEHTSWEAGPFAHPIAAPEVEIVLQPGGGEPRAFEARGVTHVVRGPREIVIRGLSGRATRRVLARWHVQRWWPVSESAAGSVAETVTPLPGSSELLTSRGASEMRVRGASEERLAGASEVYFLGASERRLRGASELLYAGASERRFPGASERAPAGASEQRVRGAEMRVPLGASEVRLGGASEVVRTASESWRVFAEAGARLAEGERPAPPAPPTPVARPAAGASEARLASGAGRGVRERTGDASADEETPRPPRW